ncbi:hypothetical protein [Flexibacterium corallicola]|uniref:hypothetical protein n=1 Tax=Flexibacterium corallicola TaxID=3037259 RepID=UPI00286F5573|nr:hypothetical protein [Pseudovibrio sp. M1P-2-3]
MIENFVQIHQGFGLVYFWLLLVVVLVFSFVAALLIPLRIKVGLFRVPYIFLSSTCALGLAIPIYNYPQYAASLLGLRNFDGFFFVFALIVVVDTFIFGLLSRARAINATGRRRMALFGLVPILTFVLWLQRPRKELRDSIRRPWIVNWAGVIVSLFMLFTANGMVEDASGRMESFIKKLDEPASKQEQPVSTPKRDPIKNYASPMFDETGLGSALYKFTKEVELPVRKEEGVLLVAAVAYGKKLKLTYNTAEAREKMDALEQGAYAEYYCEMPIYRKFLKYGAVIESQFISSKAVEWEKFQINISDCDSQNSNV